MYDGEYGAHNRSKAGNLKSKRGPSTADSDFEGDEEVLADGKPGRRVDVDHDLKGFSSLENVASTTPKGAEGIVKKRAPPPMPDGPAPSMPRKARDVLAGGGPDGVSASQKRPSIDSLISEDKRSDFKGNASDEDELGTDFIKVCSFMCPISMYRGLYVIFKRYRRKDEGMPAILRVIPQRARTEGCPRAYPSLLETLSL